MSLKHAAVVKVMESEDTAENECSKEESESALKVVANEKSITTQKQKEQKK